MKKRLKIALFVLGLCSPTYANKRTISAQGYALAPNAGGQVAYSLRYSPEEKTEYSAFANTSLFVGKVPLSGIIYSKRLTLCERCLVSSFAQVGAGASLAGPMLEFDWNITPLWLLRIDFATHIYFFRIHGIVWSYPLWLGVSLPF